MNNKEKIIKEIKEIESYIFDKDMIRENKEEIKTLKKLYKKLGHSLSSEDQADVIEQRKYNMYEMTGELSEPFIYQSFCDKDVQ